MTEMLDQMLSRHHYELMKLFSDEKIDAYRAGAGGLEIASSFQGHPELHIIAGEVAFKYGITFSQIRGHDRRRRFCWPRHEAFYEAYEAGYSLTQIGGYFEGRDHTTVLNGVRQHEKRMENDGT